MPSGQSYNLLGGDSVAGGKLKETDATSGHIRILEQSRKQVYGSSGWLRNEMVIPRFGIYGYWWSSTEYNSSAIAHFRYMSYDLAS